MTSDLKTKYDADTNNPGGENIKNRRKENLDDEANITQLAVA